MEKEISVGLIAAPELPAEIAKNSMDKLAALFAEKIDETISWKIEMIIDPLSGSAEDVDDILDEAMIIRNDKSWDFAICLTDLPIFYGKEVVAADTCYKNNIAQISIPAFGWLPFRSAIKNAIVHILKELVYYSSNVHGKNPEKDERLQQHNQLEKQFPLLMVKRIKPSEIPKDVDFRYLVIPRINGKIRLLIGMTQSNRPMSIMTSFKKVIAIAFTTGAFGLIFTTMWKLSIILSTGRLSGLMVAAISLLITWIIATHNLWERPSTRNEKGLRHLYNLTTFFTLFFSVITYYFILLILFLIVTLVLIPPEVFKSALEFTENPGIIQYLRLAWLATSISTIAGAIGAGMENEELVRDITYGYRQKRRYNEIKKHE
ncbi:hypothetical protein CIL05_05895 [Virgibacillus profundi]|uniref:5,10-methylene-tetrahydrofolate dehydrogenase n=1 Tax=Virgibacillus profundi TaxID=2024555 RepID=A0A2A2IGG5_9BACI|nr:5,10-methylene-tetrahydrofolate dehydrogenase [Virgibacillus profundi]PAV30632.1 hypothetical protein CIL05_05895 [Virgibacillus profundi]PXY54804.1 5,10-methylene-tetrahydrofolate dehydrogenase [Virgibacillus profundi]